MKPYYDQDGITIYHGDCNDILPELPNMDLLLTDPPYGLKENPRRNKSRGKLAMPKDYGNYNWDNHVCQKETELAISRSTNQIIFGGNYYQLPPTSCWLVWHKDNGNTDFADCELAWTNMKKAVRLFKWRWSGMLQENMGREKEFKVHPTQKPLAVMKWCITKAPDDVKTILDPFMGSGTALRAAKDLGRQAIGIELDEKYCESAAERLAQGVLF